MPQGLIRVHASYALSVSRRHPVQVTRPGHSRARFEELRYGLGVFGAIFFFGSSYRQQIGTLILQHGLFSSSLLCCGARTRDLLLPAIALVASYIIYGQQRQRKEKIEQKRGQRVFRFVIVGIDEKQIKQSKGLKVEVQLGVDVQVELCFLH
jgi:hypothetical protein